MAKDLFADTTMSFGEHLEALRSHLFRCLIYLLVALVPAVYLSEVVLDLVTAPIVASLTEYYDDAGLAEEGDAATLSLRESVENILDWRGLVGRGPRRRGTGRCGPRRSSSGSARPAARCGRR